MPSSVQQTFVGREKTRNGCKEAIRKAEAKELILSVWDVNVSGHRAFVAGCDHKISLVKVYNAPNEMPDSVYYRYMAPCYLSVVILPLFIFLTVYLLLVWKINMTSLLQ